MEVVLADCLYSCEFCWLFRLLHIYPLLFLCQLRSLSLRPNLVLSFSYKANLILPSLHSCRAFLSGIYLLSLGFIKVCYNFVLMFLLLSFVSSVTKLFVISCFKMLFYVIQL